MALSDKTREMGKNNETVCGVPGHPQNKEYPILFKIKSILFMETDTGNNLGTKSGKWKTVLEKNNTLSDQCPIARGNQISGYPEVAEASSDIF